MSSANELARCWYVTIIPEFRLGRIYLRAAIRLIELSMVASKDSKMSDMEATTGFLKYNLWLTKLSWYLKLVFFA